MSRLKYAAVLPKVCAKSGRRVGMEAQVIARFISICDQRRICICGTRVSSCSATDLLEKELTDKDCIVRDIIRVEVYVDGMQTDNGCQNSNATDQEDCNERICAVVRVSVRSERVRRTNVGGSHFFCLLSCRRIKGGMGRIRMTMSVTMLIAAMLK